MRRNSSRSYRCLTIEKDGLCRYSKGGFPKRVLKMVGKRKKVIVIELETCIWRILSFYLVTVIFVVLQTKTTRLLFLEICQQAIWKMFLN